MITFPELASPGAAMLLLLALQACSGSNSIPDQPADRSTLSSDRMAKSGKESSEQAASLAFEWSANGFEQLEARYQWAGSGMRDDVFEPHLSLSVPETDDIIWSSSCTAGGKVETRLYLAPPKAMQGNRAVFRFETDQSPSTRTYPAHYVADGQYDGFAIVQSASDPMFAEMKAGKWAYIQIGEGSDGTKLRISLAGAAKALNAFLPACSGAKEAKPAASTSTASYHCDDGRTITASYLGNDTDTPVARLSVDGEVLLLAQTMSGSGARYEGEGSRGKMSWLTKADDGVLIMEDADDADGSNEQTTRCLAQ